MTTRTAVAGLAVIVLGTMNPGPALTAAPATAPVSWDIEATEAYAGGRGRGHVTHCPGAPAGARRLLIVVGGIGSAANPQADPARTCRFGADSWEAYARGRGFDLYLLTWYKPTDYVQRNAFVLVGLIEKLQSSDPAASESGLVIVGPSMGGLVSRYALAHMETKEQAHGVKLFISVDSPHRGAYVPIGVQFLTAYFANDWANAQARRLLEDQIDAPAPQQMLFFHHSQAYNTLRPYTNLFERLYFVELRGQLGDYPKARDLRMVAIANGRKDGQWEAPQPGSLLLRWQSPRVTIDSRTIPIQLAIPRDVPVAGGRVLFDRKVPITTAAYLDVRVHALQGGKRAGTVFAAYPLFTLNGRSVDLQNRESVLRAMKPIIARQIPDTPKVAGFSPRRIWNDQADRILRPHAAGVVSRVNSYLDANPRYKPRDIRISSEFSHEGAPGGKSNKTQDAETVLRAVGTIVGPVQRHHNFIPTLSALGIDQPLTLNLAGLGDSVGPFAKIYYHDSNTGHLGGNADRFIRQEITRLLGGP